MDTKVQITLTYLMTFTKEDLGLEDNISDEEFIEAAEKHALNDMDMNEWIPTDIEIEIKED